MSQTLYKKEISKNGKVKYIPIREYSEEMHSSMPEGVHMVVVKPGLQSYTYRIDPDYATLYAAYKMMEDDLVKILIEASEMRPKNQPLTDQQREAWAKFKEEYGQQDLSILYGPSIMDISNTLKEIVVNKAEDILKTPSVKIAWDKFQTIVALTK